jgi:hypothetical protein
MTSSISVQTSTRGPIRVKEANRLLVSEGEVVARWISHRSAGFGSEQDIEFVDPRLEVQSSFGIPMIYQPNAFL